MSSQACWLVTALSSTHSFIHVMPSFVAKDPTCANALDFRSGSSSLSAAFCNPTSALKSPTESLSPRSTISPHCETTSKNRRIDIEALRRRLSSAVELTCHRPPLAVPRPTPWHPNTMAPMKSPKSNHSSNYGEGIVRQADILASCYVVDAATASLKGLHYCTTGLTGAEWYS